MLYQLSYRCTRRRIARIFQPVNRMRPASVAPHAKGSMPRRYGLGSFPARRSGYGVARRHGPPMDFLEAAGIEPASRLPGPIITS